MHDEKGSLYCATVKQLQTQVCISKAGSQRPTENTKVIRQHKNTCFALALLSKVGKKMNVSDLVSYNYKIAKLIIFQPDLPTSKDRFRKVSAKSICLI